MEDEKEEVTEETIRMDKYVAAIASSIFAHDKSPEKLKNVYQYFLKEFTK